MSENLESVGAVVVKPGDTVLIGVSNDPDEQDRHRIIEHLSEACPNVQFVIFTNAIGIAVVRG